MDSRKEEEYSLLSQSEDPCPQTEVRRRVQPFSSKRTIVLSIGLILSVGINLFLLIAYFGPKSRDRYNAPSEYAGLHYDTPTIFEWDTEYGPASKNQTRQDELWEAYTISRGIIALSDDYARSKNIPLSQRFPWDKSRGIYLLSGYHKLHCLKKIRRWIVSTERGSHRIDHFGHIQHCLDALRQDIICQADDTPLYTTADDDPVSGRDQIQHCRSWSKLEAWAKPASACFGYVNETNDESGGIEFYRFCPRDSPFAPTMRKYFNFDDDYFEEPVERVPPY